MLDLVDFLEMCDPFTKVAITNENGVGGAAYVAWPNGGWTAAEALDELGCGGYHVCGVEVRDGMLYIYADENPWDYGSYWEGEWSHGPKEGYMVELRAEMCVVEGCEEDAKSTAMDMLSCGHVDDAKLRIVEKHPMEYVRDNWGM